MLEYHPLLRFSYSMVFLVAKCNIKCLLLKDYDYFAGETTVNHWGHDAIMLLTNTYREYKELFDSPDVNKIEIWKSISCMMREKGYNYSAEACSSKMRALKYR